jgi:broad specificity phosphatase PhoE
MSTLLLVRHGQARLFTDNYDRLSDLGLSQAGALGEFWLERGIRPDSVFSGTMVRQRQTAEAIGKVFMSGGEHWPDPQENAGLNEYPAKEICDSILHALRKTDATLERLAVDLESSTSPADKYRYLHRMLETVIARWVSNDYGDADVPVSWQYFSEEVRKALRDVTSNAGRGQTIAVFTSGGPVAISVQSVLQAPDIKAAELNWRVHNCSVTRYTFSGERISLDAFNDVSHLPVDLHTYR